MEPQIQYARTADGVNIAFAVTGTGPPLLLCPQGMISHIVEQYRVPQIRVWWELLEQRYTLIRYDYRGFGSSQRNVDQLSAESLVRDIEGVVKAVDAGPVAVLGSMINAAIACMYADHFPAHVSHLILWSAGWGDMRSERVKKNELLDHIAFEDWSLFARLRMQSDWGWASQEQARAYTRILRESTDAKTYFAFVDVWKQLEVGDLLSRLAVPTLVVRSDSPNAPYPGGSERLAASIPGARMLTLHGPDHLPWLSENAASEGAAVVAELLEGVPRSEQRPPSPHASEQETAIILFADIIDSTALTERLGDVTFRARSRKLDADLRERVRANGGRVIDAKTLGDGILATFPAASQAIATSLSFASAANDLGLDLHIGLHAGDLIREENNVYGGAVNVAARICALSAPGEILVSRTVADLARTSADVAFEDRGEHPLKGITDPVRMFAVRRVEGG